MDSQSDDIQILFLKYSSGKATPAEVEKFLKLLTQGTFDQEMIRSMTELINTTSPEENLDHQRWNAVLTKIQKQIFPAPLNSKLWWKVCIAASITIILGLSLLIYQNLQNNQLKVSVKKYDIAPGKNGATLTLANGKKIRLNSALNGKVAEEPGVVISKTASGELIYQVVGGTSSDNSNQINILSTANGETYHLRLPDGSEVWLNAGSSLSYNTSLVEDGKRRVRLAGEAYFEIAKDKEHPFIVSSNNQEIEVLGTHFNVNAYDDEPVVKTTLLEGSVQIKSLNGKLIKMKPGQQVSMTGNTFNTINIDPEDAIAWTKGQLQFNDKTIPEIMRQIAKWYDVQVIFDLEIPQGEWSGSISRHRPLSQVIRMLEKSNRLKFRVEGKKLYVTKNNNLNN